MDDDDDDDVDNYDAIMHNRQQLELFKSVLFYLESYCCDVNYLTVVGGAIVSRTDCCLFR